MFIVLCINDSAQITVGVITFLSLVRATTTTIRKFISITKLTKNIPNSLKNYGASLNIIKQAGDGAITSMQGLFLATNGLNDAQTKAFLVKNQLRMGTKALTEAELIQVFTEKGMTAEKAKETAAEVTNTVAKGANAGASGTQTVANLGLLGSIKAVTTGLIAQAAAWLASPMGMVTVTAAAIYGIVKAYDALTITLKEQKEKLNEIRNEYNNLTQSLKTTEGELKSVKDRMSELLDLQKTGKITFVEEDELQKLKETNIELEKQFELLKIRQENKDKELAENVTKTFEIDLNKADLSKVYENGKIVGYNFWHGVEDFFGTITLGLFGTPRWVDALVDSTRGGISGSLATENEYLEQQVTKYEELGIRLHDTTVKIEELSAKEANKSISKDEKKELKQLRADAKEYEDIHTYLVKKQEEFEGYFGNLKLIENPTTDEEKAFNEWYQLFDNLGDTIYAISEPENYREWQLDKILNSDKFSDVVNKLKELSDKWELSPSVIESYSEFNAAIEEIGVTSKDVADKLNGISIPPEFIEFDGGKLIQNVRFIQSELDKGEISFSEYEDRLKELGATFEDTGSYETFIEIFGRIAPAVQDASKAIGSEFNNIYDSFNKLTSAIEKLKSGGILSSKEIMDLVEGGQIELSDVVVDKNGFMSVPISAFQKGIDKIYENWNKFIDNQKAGISTSLENNQKSYDNGLIDYETYFKERTRLQEQYNTADTFREADFSASTTDFTKTLNDALSQYKSATNEFEKTHWADVANSALAGLKKKCEETGKGWEDYAIQVAKVNNTTKSSVKTYEDTMSALKDLTLVYTDSITQKAMDDQQVTDLLKKYPELAAYIKHVADGHTVESTAVGNLITDYKELAKARLEDSKEIAAINFQSVAGVNVENTIKNISKAIHEGLITSSEEYLATLGDGVIPGLKEFIDKLIAAKVEGELLDNEISTQTATISKLNSELDSIQSAYTTLMNAVDEYNNKNYLSVDTLQSILNLGGDYIDLLFDENGQLKLNKEAVEALAYAKIDELEITTLRNHLDLLTSLKDEKTATEYLKTATDNQTDALTLLNNEMANTLAGMIATGEISEEIADKWLTTANNIRSAFDETRKGVGQGGLGGSKSTPLDKLLNTSKLYAEQIKDLKKQLDPINKEIADLQIEEGKAQTFGDEAAIQKYTNLLIDAKNRQIDVYKQMTTSLHSFKEEINTTFAEFTKVDLSEFGISDYRRNIENQITALENLSGKTESDTVKRNNDIAIQGLNERLSRFNEYVTVVQQANDDIFENDQKIKDLELDIYTTKYQLADSESDKKLSSLKEVYERTSDEKVLIAGILGLINNENISLTQKIKLQKEYNHALADEYRQKIKDVEHEESFTPKTDYAKLSDTALEKIRLAEEEIARLKSTPDENGVLYTENSEAVRAERSNILQYQSQYTENQIALLDAEYNKTSDLVVLRQKLLDLSKSDNISTIDKANILTKIEDVDLSKYKENIESINFAESFLNEDDFNGRLEYVKEKITAANENISHLLSQGYTIDSKAVQEMYSDILGYEKYATDIKRQEVDAYLALEEKKIEQHNYHNDWLEDSERQTYSRMLSALDDYHAQGLLSEQDYYDLREQYSRKYAESGRKEVDVFLEAEEKKIEAKNYYNAWFEDSEIDSYHRILAALDDYHTQGLLKEQDYYELREQYMRKLYDAEENQLTKAYKGKQKAAVDAIQAEIDALQNLSKAKDKEIEQVNALIKSLEKQKALYDKAISAVGDTIDGEIDKLKEQKAALEASNKAQKDRIELAELEERNRLARENRVARIYHQDGDRGFEFEANQKAIKEAEKAINDFNFKQQTDAIDAQIAAWERYKQQWVGIAGEYEREQNKLIAEQILGKNWEQLVLSQRTDILRNFAQNQYKLNEQMLDGAKKRAEGLQSEKSAMEESTRAQIEALEKLKDGWSKALDVEEDIIKYDGSLQDLIGLESDSYENRMNKLEEFIGKWNTAVSNIKDINMSYPTTEDINAQMQSGGGSGTGDNNSVGRHDPLGNPTQKSSGTLNSTKDSDIGKYNLNGVAIDMSEEIPIGNSGDATLFMNFTDYLKNKVAWVNADDATKAILNGQNQAYREALHISSDTMTSDDARKLLDQIASGAIKYAKGTKFAVGGLSIVDEEGKELILRQPSEGRNTTLEYGDAVVPAKLTKNIFDMAENPEEWIKDNLKSDKKPSYDLTLISKDEYYEKLGWSKELVNFNATVANYPNPVATQMYDNFVKSQNAILNSINTKNEPTVITPTIGDIHIHNPIGDADSLAKDISNKFGNAFTQAMYKKR